MILLDIREVVDAKEIRLDTREVMEESAIIVVGAEDVLLDTREVVEQSTIIVVEAEDILLETGEVAEDPAGDNTNNSILPNFMNDSFIHDSDSDNSQGSPVPVRRRGNPLIDESSKRN